MCFTVSYEVDFTKSSFTQTSFEFVFGKGFLYFLTIEFYFVHLNYNLNETEIIPVFNIIKLYLATH